jgi:hypothetical protein
MKVKGFDTETYKGYVKVLTTSDHEYIESSDTIKLLDFLYDKGNNDYNVFYNIEYDLGSILKEYIVSNGEKLHDAFYEKIKAKQLQIVDLEEESGYSFNVENYHIVYLSGKMFSLAKNKTTRYFWDASNFYKSGFGHMSLNEASKKYLGKVKNNEELSIDRAKIGSEQGYYEKHRNEIILYSIYDCILTKELFERTIKSYGSLGLKFPLKPYSEASIFKEYLNDKWDNEIEWGKMYLESSYNNYFHNAYRGGLFQTWKIGHYDNVYDIDLNSAYPYVASQLYSIVDSTITKDKEGDYTFYKIIAKPNRFLPLRNGLRLIYGTSSKEYVFYITEWDKKILDLYGYPYKIDSMIGIQTQKKLLLPEINRFFELKNKIKKEYGSNSVEYLNIKIFLNAGYGVFAQSYPQYTKFTNFIYSSYMTAKTRYEIAKLNKELNDLGDSTISISTDGILLRQNKDKGIEYFKDNYYGEEIGKWKVDFYDSVWQYANGIYLLWKNGRYTLKKRGFEMLTIKDLYSNESELRFKKPKPMKIISAIIQRQYDKLNDFFEQEKIFSPYQSWISINPKLAQEIFDWKISDFQHRQKDVPLLNIDDYPYLIQKVNNND